MSSSPTVPSENLAVHAHRKFIMGRRVKRLVDHIVNLIPDKSSTILDVGTGTGEIAQAILEKKTTVNITGTDVYVRPRTIIPVIKYDGCHLPFADNAFDLVMVIDVLHHCTDPTATLSECARVARQGLIIKDHIANNLWDRARLRFMDWIGNRAHGVALPYNYLSSEEWNKALVMNKLRLKKEVRRLNLYPHPAELLFGGSLHCLYLLYPTQKDE
jgi:SAM-dependent methyltransferase